MRFCDIGSKVYYCPQCKQLRRERQIISSWNDKCKYCNTKVVTVESVLREYDRIENVIAEVKSLQGKYEAIEAELKAEKDWKWNEENLVRCSECRFHRIDKKGNWTCTNDDDTRESWYCRNGERGVQRDA